MPNNPGNDIDPNANSRRAAAEGAIMFLKMLWQLVVVCGMCPSIRLSLYLLHPISPLLRVVAVHNNLPPICPPIRHSSSHFGGRHSTTLSSPARSGGSLSCLSIPRQKNPSRMLQIRTSKFPHHFENTLQ
ncbi:hypothetical protein M404DRAFT_992356 [Pisolithus tinctorius Marx 270]|uniref:Uncharacterized protein n=1 Tax=Pisolithus tinctorius Marx 270 TaxID=870435 RepID=A0A0C3KX46_PISTI|nr:hypothetical protein M404DRAFT_992356 [Pisolithus tinctorius Marx 270]